MRIGTQGLFHPYLKTFVPPLLPTRLTAPGSPRMGALSPVLENFRPAFSPDPTDCPWVSEEGSRLATIQGDRTLVSSSRHVETKIDALKTLLRETRFLSFCFLLLIDLAGLKAKQINLKSTNQIT